MAVGQLGAAPVPGVELVVVVVEALDEAGTVQRSRSGDGTGVVTMEDDEDCAVEAAVAPVVIEPSVAHATTTMLAAALNATRAQRGPARCARTP